MFPTEKRRRIRLAGTSRYRSIQFFGISENLESLLVQESLHEKSVSRVHDHHVNQGMLHRINMIIRIDMTFRAKPVQDLSEQSQRDERETSGLLTSSRTLKSDRDSTANRPSTRADKREDLSVVRTRLRIQQIPRIKNRLGLHRQAKTR